MSLNYQDGLEATETFYIPLTVPRNGSQSWVFEIPDYDVTGYSAILAEIKEYPDIIGAADLSLTIGTVSVDDTTWADFITAHPDATLPAGAEGTDAIKVSTINMSVTTAGMQLLPTDKGQCGANAQLFWDMVVQFGSSSADRIIAGEFNISGSISGVTLS